MVAFAFQCEYVSRTLTKVESVNAELAARLDERGCFITATDVDELIVVDPALKVLVRTSQTRFLCRVDELKDKLAEIERRYEEIERTKGSPAVLCGADYVRDVSFPCDEYQDTYR